jgi:hypothetical protein
MYYKFNWFISSNFLHPTLLPWNLKNSVLDSIL